MTQLMNFNYDDDPDWVQGYLYSPKNPGTLDGKITGKFEIIEDDEKGSLAKAILEG